MTQGKPISLLDKRRLHEKCQEGIYCNGPGCKLVTGKTARKWAKKTHGKTTQAVRKNGQRNQ